MRRTKTPMTLQDAENAIRSLCDQIEILDNDLTEAYERIDQLRDAVLLNREPRAVHPVMKGHA